MTIATIGSDETTRSSAGPVAGKFSADGAGVGLLDGFGLAFEDGVVEGFGDDDGAEDCDDCADGLPPLLLLLLVGLPLFTATDGAFGVAVSVLPRCCAI